MKVILTERVPALGNVGDVVNVSAGYARNYLLPKRFAVVADEKNNKALEISKKRLTKKINEAKLVAQELKKKVDGLEIEVTKKVGGNGRLFGTVTNSELAKELAAKGVEVERKLIFVDTPIKSLGVYSCTAKLFQEVEAKFKVKVLIDPAQAEEEKKKREAGLGKKKAKKGEENAAPVEVEAGAEETSENAEAAPVEAVAKESKKEAKTAPKKEKKPRAKKEE